MNNLKVAVSNLKKTRKEIHKKEIIRNVKVDNFGKSINNKPDMELDDLLSELNKIL